MTERARPWGQPPEKSPPTWFDWVFQNDKARENEEEWKKFEAKKRGVVDKIVEFQHDSSQIRKNFNNMFMDGVDDSQIPGRIFELWWWHDRYKKHHSEEYIKKRNAAWEREYKPWIGEVDAEYHFNQKWPDPETIEPLYPENVKLAHRLLKRARGWDRTKPEGKLLWKRLVLEFTRHDEDEDAIEQFEKDIEQLVAEMEAKEAEEKSKRAVVESRASVVDAVFEAHALNGRAMRV